jgi:hypothetical protein
MRKYVGRNIERERKEIKRKRDVVIFNYFYMHVLETIV